MKNKAVVYLLALAAFLIGTIEYIITGIIQMVADDLQVTTSAAGLLVTSLALSAAIGAPIVIALTINIDRRKILSWMLIIFTLSNIITSVSHSFEMVLMTRVLQGISGGTAIVVAMAVATRLVEREKRGTAIGIILMGLSSSLVLGVPISTFLSSMIGWKALFAAIGVITLIPLIVVYRRIPSMKEQESVTLRMQLSILKDKRILLAVAVTLFYVGGYSTLFTYLTPFLQASANLSITEISGILLLAGICSFLGSSLGGMAADKKGPIFTIFSGIILQIMMLMLLAFVTGNLVVMVAVIMIWMIATWSTSPAQQLYLVTLVPKSPDIALSVNTSFIQFGFALGSGVGGLVLSRTSILNLSWISAGTVLLALLMTILMVAFDRISQHKSLKVMEQGR
ncbi:MFS transporter [Bacillus altitudinis]|uniref:DHA1 family putative efflux transporter-like MFS transporter n=1 Tax=Bacillus aerius TaxID=293388 RepID=A0ABR6B6R2_9BACI|nr:MULTISPECIES: MFS transporter [Bacillus]MCA1020218.1 MFS transporter [Bacillus stratosphericus]CVN61531.1 major facilitator superfamily protein [Streptococcus pneumoniae]MBA8919841.1 DHA1 family putative efflux transporter-like MFS transporter [Bacillus aerius]MCY7499515.1 MFS transporter [Bacillus altitudinis]MCY7536510.1 MFS transporter [Bacillus altitudinis]